MRTYTIEYRCDGGYEFWGEITATSADEAIERATAREPVCVQGLPLSYRATEIR